MTAISSAIPATDARAIQVGRYLGLAKATEEQLRDALVLIAERHERDYDVWRTASIVAGWSREHLEWLEPFAERYRVMPSERPEKLRGALLSGTRVGATGMLDDLRDVAILGEEAETTWTILFQGAKELQDSELLTVASDAREHAKRVLRWIRTEIDHNAPETLAVAMKPDDELAGSMPRRANAIASIPDPVWSPLASGFVILVVAAVSLLVGRPFLFPSLGPTAALVASEPAQPSSRGWNILVGHLGGLIAAVVGLLVFGAFGAPTLFADKVLDPGRAGASVLAIALTVLVGILARASHPPAAATVLLVTLGGIRTFEDGLNLVIGVVIVTALGELVRRIRLERRSPAERQAPAGGLMARWIRGAPPEERKPAA
ncbi:MAG: HPP family protein [Chloroflexota bacterium]